MYVCWIILLQMNLLKTLHKEWIAFGISTELLPIKLSYRYNITIAPMGPYITMQVLLSLGIKRKINGLG